MRFWDSSAIVPLLLRQPRTDAARSLLDEDDEMVVWWASQTECASKFARLRREQSLDVDDESRALRVLHELSESWHEVRPTEDVRALSLRLLRTHPLRSADALQLAAALSWAGRPQGEALVTYDERLGRAARLEGFRVVPS
ncbi:MAG: type II toxin-antitoxin system VapC family toxin [Gemmatimonadetes bacterium]|nr:type II toxin-antitoxin system VapC family toxin [Gemmatimonadota bacterium]